MNPLGALTPVNPEQVTLGAALAFDIFDAWGNLLHDKGSVVTDSVEFAAILEDGYFEDSMGDAPPINPPSMSGWPNSSAALFAFTLPP